MKTKTAKPPKRSNRSLKVKDLAPKQTPKGGTRGSRLENDGTYLNHNETLVSDSKRQRLTRTSSMPAHF